MRAQPRPPDARLAVAVDPGRTTAAALSGQDADNGNQDKEQKHRLNHGL